ncbi:sulfate ABC transporter permease subunit CysT [Sporolactobacillus sp. THM19-2]|nr:sulfate ABC transporter permease subunit CysT [Sporolactobacillus sp. THM19-2]RYL90953.1 sulfate ABC transporter permease subunit CysT [Sporolactobacillus sp. THM19-2]
MELSIVAFSQHLKKGRSIPGFGLTMGLSTFYLSLLVLIPLSFIFIYSARSGWASFWQDVTNPRVVASYKLSFLTALAAAFVNLIFGVLIAWVLTRYTFPWKRAVDGLVDLPFALPTAVAGITLTTLYSENGWIGRWLPFDVSFTPIGITIALIFVGLPFVVRMVQPVLQNFEREVEEASSSLGATPFQTFRKVIFPQLMPAALSGFSLAFARSLGEYGSVVFIAGNMPYKTEIAPLMIMTKLEQFDYSAATAIAVVMLVISFLLILLINLIQWWSRLRYAGR